MKKVYVVEDDDGIRELIEFLLVHQDYSAKTFPTARSFKKAVQKDTPDLFLLDVMLPDGNGLDLCSELKNNQSTKNIPVILMSAHHDVNKSNGAEDFIAKPFDVDELLERIDNQLNAG